MTAIISYVALEYFGQNSIRSGRMGSSAHTRKLIKKADGSSGYKYYEESITWSEVAKEYFTWSLFYILAVWVLWSFMSSTF